MSSVREDSEEASVEAYRLARFIDLGFSIDDAERLNLSHADWHEVEHLLEHGCTRELALSISV